jgi:putative DNA primase/helicase
MKIITQNHEIKQENSSVAGIDADAIRAEFETFSKQNTPDAEGFANEDVEDFMSNAPLTDTGNAECFEFEHGSEYRHNITNNQWLRWNGIIWEADKNSKIDADILSIVRHRQSVAVGAETSQINDKVRILNYLVRCENVRSRKDIKQAAQWLPKFATTIDQYDTEKNLASTQNGTLNLSDGNFYEARRGDYITRQLGANHDETAKCSRWEQFLNEIFNGDADLIRFIQKVVGYSLTGDTSEQKMFIGYGFGKNGKTVFVNAIQALAGDYAGSASFKTFDADKQSEQTNDLAMLKGKRFVSMIESAADKKLNEPLIKQVTGGDKITCRFLHKEFFEYFPQFKLFLATNHKPVITQTDFGIWRRIVLIPFTQNFEGREEKGLEETLKGELSGILNWAMEGLRLWQKEGLKPLPEAVTNATDNYKQESDTVGQWLEQRTIADKARTVKSSTAYIDYKDWAGDNGYYPLGTRSFKSALEEKQHTVQHTRDGNLWIGFGLRSRF